jgi:hypothetical protein
LLHLLLVLDDADGCCCSWMSHQSWVVDVGPINSLLSAHFISIMQARSCICLTFARRPKTGQKKKK